MVLHVVCVMTEKDENYLAGFNYSKDTGYAQYLDREEVEYEN